MRFLRLISKSQTLVAAIICAREIRPILQPNLVVAVSKIAQFLAPQAIASLRYSFFETAVHFSYSLLYKAELKEIIHSFYIHVSAQRRQGIQFE